MRRAALVFVVLLLPRLATAGQNAAQDSATLETVGKVLRFLEDSGYQYTKIGSSVWTIPFKGANRPSIPLVVSAANGRLVIDAGVAARAEIGDDARVVRELLRLNATVPGATLVVDEDGDYVARGWYALSELDSAKFKEALHTVAVAADGAYSGIKRYLPASGASAPVPSKPPERSGPPGAVRTFATPASATKHLEFLNGKAVVSFDPARWKETASDDPSRATFEYRPGEGFAMVIAERVQLAPGQLRELALRNARKVSLDAAVVEEQPRRVNGTDVVLVSTAGTTDGVKIAYLGYYYTGAAGTVQVVVYTDQNSLAGHRKDFEDFLNGLQVAADGTDVPRSPSSAAFREFVTPPTATRQVEVLRGRATHSYDPDKWRPTPAQDNDWKTFDHGTGGALAMVIAERTARSTEQLRTFVLDSVRPAIPDARVVEEERRRVNGTEVLMLRLEGTAKGRPFTYFSYNYSGPLGTVQVMAGTAIETLGRYRKDIEDFLNGLQIR